MIVSHTRGMSVLRRAYLPMFDADSILSQRLPFTGDKNWRLWSLVARPSFLFRRRNILKECQDGVAVCKQQIQQTKRAAFTSFAAQVWARHIREFCLTIDAVYPGNSPVRRSPITTSTRNLGFICNNLQLVCHISSPRWNHAADKVL